MRHLFIKLGATGDVVRTTPLLRALSGTSTTWLTSSKNIALVDGIASDLRCVSWEDRHLIAQDDYDLLINLEDDLEIAVFAASLKAHRTFGACLDKGQTVTYTQDSKEWFDLSLISVYGRERADQLKLRNRRTYQDLVFGGLGLKFAGEKYLLPSVGQSEVAGDVAIASVAGPVWPMKSWAYYDALKSRLEAIGLRVNYLPQRQSLLQHLSDVRSHRCLVSGDSLPMHLALGTETPCVSIFNCTSPWEIYDYGLQTQMVSPLLEEFFYKRGFDPRATTAISLDEVFEAVLRRLKIKA